ncbi:hypothetical protein T02_10221 [Trichinella nativa]|uniref:Uncharacterized protein n=1 Tax=Trichinella nativa TaxID=6335 RepID=A0A0V1KKB5_9BILA|nr:hypothetical protein T02_10221 [Trichinella nativa]
MLSVSVSKPKYGTVEQNLKRKGLLKGFHDNG